jgi:hypothetical protein
MVHHYAHISIKEIDLAVFQEAKKRKINVSKLLAEAVRKEIDKPYIPEGEEVIPIEVRIRRLKNKDPFNFDVFNKTVIAYLSVKLCYQYLSEFKKFTQTDPEMTALELFNFYYDIFKESDGEGMTETVNKILEEECRPEILDHQ